MATLIGLGLCIDDLTATFSSASAPPIKAGTIVEGDCGRWKFVYNTGTYTITQYHPCVCAATNNCGYVANVTAAAALAAKACAGVAMTAIAPTEYGWIQCGGIGTCYVSAAHATVGEAMQCGAGAYLTIVSAATDFPVGVALAAITVAGNIPVMLNIA
jgi:hypothetical protein